MDLGWRGEGGDGEDVEEGEGGVEFEEVAGRGIWGWHFEIGRLDGEGRMEGYGLLGGLSGGSHGGLDFDVRRMDRRQGRLGVVIFIWIESDGL